jgi:hypothetical protein
VDELLQELGRLLDERVGEETARDYLIRRWLKIRAKDGKKRGLDLNLAQREYSRNCCQRNIVLKARQVGITTYVAARFFVQTITRPGTLTVQVAHSQESAEVIFNIVRRFWENLPKAIRGARVKSRSNVRQMVFPRIDSEYRVETADENAGRGMTIQNLHCSEVSRWPRGGLETLASLRAAVVPGGEIVLESTPNGASGAFYGEWQRAEETGYTRHFFPWWFEESYREIVNNGVRPFSEEEAGLIAREGLDEGQIAWRRNQWKMLRALGAQEYVEDANSCFLVSGECVFEVEAIERAVADAGGATAVEDNGRLTIWLPPRNGKRYIVGVDTAGGGVDGDYACAQVIEREMGMQCAELHGHFPPYELARRVKELGDRYEGALVAVERNNHGYAVLVHLGHLGCANLFQQSGKTGWLTSASTRPAMIENMAAVLVEKPGLFHSLRLLEECRTFVRRADGNAAAAEGAHDDCVMALAIALAVRKEDVGRDVKKKRLEVGSLVMSERLPDERAAYGDVPVRWR